MQISRQMAIYGQTIGVFKRENNEGSSDLVKRNLQKNKVVVFEFRMCGLCPVFRHDYVILTSRWRNFWRNMRYSTTYAEFKKPQFWFYEALSFRQVLFGNHSLQARESLDRRVTLLQWRSLLLLLLFLFLYISSALEISFE